MKPKPEEIDGWMRDTELAWIRSQAAHCSHLIIEIGSYRGRSTRAWADHAPESCLIICIDAWRSSKDGYYDGPPDYQVFAKNLSDVIMAGRLITIASPSDDAISDVERLVSGYGHLADLVFIDGDHSGPAVARDIKNYLPFVKTGGIISGHDYDRSHAGLRRAVDRAFGDQVRLTESKTQAIWWTEVKR